MKTDAVHPGKALSGACALVGVGETRFVKETDQDPRDLAVEAVLAALADAGLCVADVDGMVIDDEVTPRVAPMNEVRAALGIENTFSVHGPATGAGYAYAPMLAAMAIASEQASVVVSYAALDFGREAPGLADFKYQNEAGDSEEFERPMGLVGTPVGYALAAMRYRSLYGLTDEQLGMVATTIRAHGAMHEGAQMRERPSMEDYLASPYLAQPLRLLDSCLRTSGAAAFIMVSPKRAVGLRQKPVAMLGAGFVASRASRRHHWTQRKEFPHRLLSRAAQRAFAMADTTPREMDFAQLQDPYSIQVILQLEDCGFCSVGEGAAFVEGGRIGLGGELPVNTHGGQLSHGYMFSATHVIEAVRQLRGQAGGRQVHRARRGLVSGFGPGENAVLILGSEAA